MRNKLSDKKKKVVVAMSGGVDSSVSVALLKEAGFDVVGVFMKLGVEEEDENKCCSSEAENGARLVAEKLKIPFYVFNFEKEFRKRVIGYFLSELRAGRTPNPCVVCNKEIKFGLFIEKALAMGADFVATGHYGKIKSQISNLKNKTKNEKRKTQNNSSKLKTFKLLKGVDKNKDQSYFLWKLNQDQLSKILFPVGGYLKSEVREIARKFNLPTAEAPESQEICFVNSTIKDFLEKKFKPSPGKIVDTCGNIIGEHQGLWFYTIGQRKGINAVNSTGKQFYVSAKDAKKNILVVTQNKKDLYKKEMTVKDVNWISGEEPKFPLRVKTKTRYQQDFFSAVISKGQKNKEIKVVFTKSQRAITPGQSAVFYKGRELLGGGII
jgi:tRNA-uridine 2-sulfurtransferase